jgi:hypothetical protein
MSKFKKGETSCNILDKKEEITKSIQLKSTLIDRINTYEDIAPSLKIKNRSISQAAVHKWNDDQLGVIRYSRNTAHSEHNIAPLNTLIKSIENANKRLASKPNIDNKKQGQTYTHRSEKAVNKLINENNYLRVALAEVYRAYMQLLDNYREDTEIDEACRKLIKNQARVLGKNRVWETK